MWTPSVDQGGTMTPNASVACIANREQPLCSTQGLDDRVYWKKFAAAAGL